MVDLCGILPCDSSKNYCISGLCIDKNYIYYGIAGIAVLLMIVKGKRDK